MYRACLVVPPPERERAIPNGVLHSEQTEDDCITVQ